MAHILLIEPDLVLARTYQTVLIRAGHKVHIANNAQQAIDEADSMKPDLVILELQLAAHNGVEFLYEFRSYPDWKMIPVIIHSNVPPGDFGVSQTNWHQLRVVDYHYKPRTTLVKLLSSVRDHIIEIQ